MKSVMVTVENRCDTRIVTGSVECPHSPGAFRERRKEVVLGLRIQGGCRLVEDQNRRITLEQPPRQREPLPLTRRRWPPQSAALQA